MKADAYIVGKFRMLRHQPSGGTHDEFEMREVVTLLRADHQEVVLVGRPSVKAVPAVEHEDLE